MNDERAPSNAGQNSLPKSGRAGSPQDQSGRRRAMIDQEARTAWEELAALQNRVTDEPLADAGYYRNEADGKVIPGKLWEHLKLMSGYYVTDPPTPDYEFVRVCNGDLRVMVELMDFETAQGLPIASLVDGISAEPAVMPSPSRHVGGDAERIADAIEMATLKERLRAATVARDAARKAIEQGFLNIIPDKVFEAIHEASALATTEGQP